MFLRLLAENVGLEYLFIYLFGPSFLFGVYRSPATWIYDLFFSVATAKEILCTVSNRRGRAKSRL